MACAALEGAGKDVERVQLRSLKPGCPHAPLSPPARPTADAAFGGKVKNIRIRQRNNSQGYRVVVIVKDDNDNEVHNVDYSGVTGTVSFTPVDGGPALSDLSMETVRNQKLRPAGAAPLQ